MTNPEGERGGGEIWIPGIDFRALIDEEEPFPFGRFRTNGTKAITWKEIQKRREGTTREQNDPEDTAAGDDVASGTEGVIEGELPGDWALGGLGDAAQLNPEPEVN